MNLDIHTAVQTALVITVLLILYSFLAGIRSIRSARGLKFFRMRRDRMVAGWRLLFIALVLIVVAIALNSFAEPVIYGFFPPTITQTLTPTITQTATITQTPTITLTPSITPTPSVTDTPTITPTPRIPLAIEARFASTITPVPGVIFSPLVFARDLDDNFLPVEPSEVFQNPVGHLYAQFSYDGMVVGSQWTAVWYRDGELVNFETKPWDGGTGGIGYTDWDPLPYEWQPAEYEVQIFVGYDWQVSGRFTVEGDAPTPPPSTTPSPTITTTPTKTTSPTVTATSTPRPSATVTITRTVTPTRTITPTPWPSPTRWPSQTPRATDTRVPSQTPTPRPPAISPTPTITLTSAPSRTPTPRFSATPTPYITSTRAPTYTITPPVPTYTRMPTKSPTAPWPTYTHMPTNTPKP